MEVIDYQLFVTSIDNAETYLAIARAHFSLWIKNNQDQKFDLIFADAWTGKYETLLSSRT